MARSNTLGIVSSAQDTLEEVLILLMVFFTFDTAVLAFQSSSFTTAYLPSDIQTLVPWVALGSLAAFVALYTDVGK